MRDFRFIIMCGGSYPKWETPRQLTEINGETIVGRTIRLLRECGVDDIAISTHDDRYFQFGVPLLRHSNDFIAFAKDGGCWAEAFFPTKEPACYLMGDVVFSPEAIRTIVNEQTDSIQFFASCPPFSPKYTKKWAEPFAFKVADQQRFRAAINFVIANENTGIFTRRPIAWELWQVINGEDVKYINYFNYRVINDYTCDVDAPEDVGNIRGYIT